MKNGTSNGSKKNGASNGSGDTAAPPPPLPSRVRARSDYSFPSLSQSDLMRISIQAGVAQPRTVVRYLRGGSVYSSTRERIETALRALGFAHLVITEPAAEAPSSPTSTTLRRP